MAKKAKAGDKSGSSGLSVKSLRYLFAKGILKGSGSNAKGKTRAVEYVKNAKRTGGAVKADHSATRAARVEKGLGKLAQFAGRQYASQQKEFQAAAQPKTGLRTMQSKYDGKYADTGQRFKAGATIQYDPSARAALKRSTAITGPKQVAAQFPGKDSNFGSPMFKSKAERQATAQMIGVRSVVQSRSNGGVYDAPNRLRRYIKGDGGEALPSGTFKAGVGKSYRDRLRKLLSQKTKP